MDYENNKIDSVLNITSPSLDLQQKYGSMKGNIVGINEDALSMYSKLEKVPDLLVESYLTLLTDLDIDDSLPSNPRERQKAMALEVTSTFHGLSAAKAAQSDAARLVSGTKEENADVLELARNEARNVLDLDPQLINNSLLRMSIKEQWDKLKIGNKLN